MIREATYEDVLNLKVNLLQAKEEPGCIDNVLGCIGRNAYTLISDSGNIICVFGFSYVWQGVIEVWSLFSQDAEKNFFAVKEIKRLMDEVPDIHRIQMTTLHGNKKLHNFAEFLGFKQEGTMVKASPLGKDMVMWGRTY